MLPLGRTLEKSPRWGVRRVVQLEKRVQFWRGLVEVDGGDRQQQWSPRCAEEEEGARGREEVKERGLDDIDGMTYLFRISWKVRLRC